MPSARRVSVRHGGSAKDDNRGGDRDGEASTFSIDPPKLSAAPSKCVGPRNGIRAAAPEPAEARKVSNKHHLPPRPPPSPASPSPPASSAFASDLFAGAMVQVDFEGMAAGDGEGDDARGGGGPGAVAAPSAAVASSGASGEWSGDRDADAGATASSPGGDNRSDEEEEDLLPLTALAARRHNGSGAAGGGGADAHAHAHPPGRDRSDDEEDLLPLMALAARRRRDRAAAGGVSATAAPAPDGRSSPRSAPAPADLLAGEGAADGGGCGGGGDGEAAGACGSKTVAREGTEEQSSTKSSMGGAAPDAARTPGSVGGVAPGGGDGDVALVAEVSPPYARVSGVALRRCPVRGTFGLNVRPDPPCDGARARRAVVEDGHAVSGAGPFRRGDVVARVNGVDVSGMIFAAVVALMRATKAGEAMVLDLLRLAAPPSPQGKQHQQRPAAPAASLLQRMHQQQQQQNTHHQQQGQPPWAGKVARFHSSKAALTASSAGATPDETYKRPMGRPTPGVAWDAIRGVWVPGGSHAAVSPQRGWPGGPPGGPPSGRSPGGGAAFPAWVAPRPPPDGTAAAWAGGSGGGEDAAAAQRAAHLTMLQQSTIAVRSPILSASSIRRAEKFHARGKSNGESGLAPAYHRLSLYDRLLLGNTELFTIRRGGLNLGALYPVFRVRVPLGPVGVRCCWCRPPPPLPSAHYQPGAIPSHFLACPDSLARVLSPLYGARGAHFDRCPLIPAGTRAALQRSRGLCDGAVRLTGGLLADLLRSGNLDRPEVWETFRSGLGPGAAVAGDGSVAELESDGDDSGECSVYLDNPLLGDGGGGTGPDGWDTDAVGERDLTEQDIAAASRLGLEDAVTAAFQIERDSGALVRRISPVRRTLLDAVRGAAPTGSLSAFAWTVLRNVDVVRSRVPGRTLPPRRLAPGAPAVAVRCVHCRQACPVPSLEVLGQVLRGVGWSHLGGCAAAPEGTRTAARALCPAPGTRDFSEDGERLQDVCRGAFARLGAKIFAEEGEGGRITRKRKILPSSPGEESKMKKGQLGPGSRVLEVDRPEAEIVRELEERLCVTARHALRPPEADDVHKVVGESLAGPEVHAMGLCRAGATLEKTGLSCAGLMSNGTDLSTVAAARVSLEETYAERGTKT